VAFGVGQNRPAVAGGGASWSGKRRTRGSMPSNARQLFVCVIVMHANVVFSADNCPNSEDCCLCPGSSCCNTGGCCCKVCPHEHAFAAGFSCYDCQWDNPPAAPPPAPLAPNGARIELTGTRPTLNFGDPESPMCTLSLNRNDGRLESTCEISTNRRRGLAQNDWNRVLEQEVDAIKKELRELRALARNDV